MRTVPLPSCANTGAAMLNNNGVHHPARFMRSSLCRAAVSCAAVAAAKIAVPLCLF
ncbi:hypothetical protein J7373_11920 [Xanthomonas sp. A2111]|uniref:Uncharacterized protein n=1 Tax=Xanthomonas hawaiiensis TaxID=3003247 RepID=A0ABU2I398_9XANT|nr:hypothetical protein [Xanthomonas sp. A2111]MBO9828957.1 hypothetical protein [Xanthomonas sp. A2111]MDS9992623.1 hypothetical protein [Xanthomonas sp. A2111]